MATKFRDFLNEQMKDEDFRREYEALELEDNIIQALIEARISARIKNSPSAITPRGQHFFLTS